MMRTVWCALLFLFHDPVSQKSAIVHLDGFGSSPGVHSQQKESANWRVSGVTVEGAEAFSADRIMNVSKLRVGQVVNQHTIQKARDTIVRAYANHGRIKAMVRIRQELRPAVPGAKLESVELRIEIVEGAVFVLRRLEFYGNATTRDQIVRRRVLQQEGEPFNQDLMEKSVNRLNSLGRFEKLTMADVEMRIDEKERFVDLLVHLNEIKRSQTRR